MLADRVDDGQNRNLNKQVEEMKQKAIKKINDRDDSEYYEDLIAE